MLIKSFSSFLRRHNRVIFGVFTVIIIVSFVGFLAPGRFGWGDNGPGGDTVGIVYGEKVTYNDLRSLSGAAALFSQGRRGGDDITQLFSMYSMLAKAKQLGVVVSDDEVVNQLRSIPAFQDDKKNFDLKKFQTFTRYQGISQQDFYTAIRIELTLNKVQRQITSGISVTEDEAYRMYQSANMKYEGLLISRKAADFEKAVKQPSARQLDTFFAANAANYVKPGNMQILVTRVNYSQCNAQAKKAMTETALQTLYKRDSKVFAGKDGKIPAFAAARKQVEKLYLAQKSKKLALQIVNNFVKEAYETLSEAPAANREKLFLQLVAKHHLTGTFKCSADFNAVKFGTLESPELARALSETTMTSCVTNPVSGQECWLAACLLKREEPRPYTFAEVKAQVARDYVTAEAKKLAESELRKERINLLKLKPEVREAAVSTWKNAARITYSRMAPNLTADSAMDGELLTSVKLNDVSRPVWRDNTVRMALVTKRIPAPEADFQKNAEMSRYLCRMQKTQAAMTALSRDIQQNCRMDKRFLNRGE